MPPVIYSGLYSAQYVELGVEAAIACDGKYVIGHHIDPEVPDSEFVNQPFRQAIAQLEGLEPQEGAIFDKKAGCHGAGILILFNHRHFCMQVVIQVGAAP